MDLPQLEYDREWTDHEAFPTTERDEEIVRADIQYLFDKIKSYLNDDLIPAILDAVAASQSSGISAGSIVTKLFNATDGTPPSCVAPNAAKLYPGGYLAVTDGENTWAADEPFTGAEDADAPFTLVLPSDMKATSFTADDFYGGDGHFDNIDTDADADVTGNADIGGNLTVGGDADVGGNLTVVGTITAPTVGGNAASATKLKNARNFQLTDGIDHSNTGVAVSFNGTANAVIPLPSILHGYLRTAIYGTETDPAAIEARWLEETGHAAPVGALYFVVTPATPDGGEVDG